MIRVTHIILFNICVVLSSQYEPTPLKQKNFNANDNYNFYGDIPRPYWPVNHDHEANGGEWFPHSPEPEEMPTMAINPMQPLENIPPNQYEQVPFNNDPMWLAPMPPRPHGVKNKGKAFWEALDTIYHARCNIEKRNEDPAIDDLCNFLARTLKKLLNCLHSSTRLQLRIPPAGPQFMQRYPPESDMRYSVRCQYGYECGNMFWQNHPPPDWGWEHNTQFMPNEEQAVMYPPGYGAQLIMPDDMVYKYPNRQNQRTRLRICQYFPCAIFGETKSTKFAGIALPVPIKPVIRTHPAETEEYVIRRRPSHTKTTVIRQKPSMEFEKTADQIKTETVLIEPNIEIEQHAEPTFQTTESSTKTEEIIIEQSQPEKHTIVTIEPGETNFEITEPPMKREEIILEETSQTEEPHIEFEEITEEPAEITAITPSMEIEEIIEETTNQPYETEIITFEPNIEIEEMKTGTTEQPAEPTTEEITERTTEEPIETKVIIEPNIEIERYGTAHFMKPKEIINEGIEQPDEYEDFIFETTTQQPQYTTEETTVSTSDNATVTPARRSSDGDDINPEITEQPTTILTTTPIQTTEETTTHEPIEAKIVILNPSKEAEEIEIKQRPTQQNTKIEETIVIKPHTQTEEIFVNQKPPQIKTEVVSTGPLMQSEDVIIEHEPSDIGTKTIKTKPHTQTEEIVIGQRPAQIIVKPESHIVTEEMIIRQKPAQKEINIVKTIPPIKQEKTIETILTPPEIDAKLEEIIKQINPEEFEIKNKEHFNLGIQNKVDNLAKLSDQYRTAIAYLNLEDSNDPEIQRLIAMFERRFSELGLLEKELNEKLLAVNEEFKLLNMKYLQIKKEEKNKEKVAVAVMKLPVKNGKDFANEDIKHAMNFFRNAIPHKSIITDQSVRVIHNSTDSYSLMPEMIVKITEQANKVIKFLKLEIETKQYDIATAMKMFFELFESLPKDYLKFEHMIFSLNPYQGQGRDPVKIIINPTQSLTVLINKVYNLVTLYQEGLVNVSAEKIFNYLIDIINVLIKRVKSGPVKNKKDKSQITVFVSE